MKIPKDKRGFVVFYGMIVLLITGFYFTGIQFAAIDQALGGRYAEIEVQSRLAAEAGMEICLQIATSTNDRFGSFSFNLSPAGLPIDNPQTRYISSFTVYYSTTRAVASFSFASVTVLLRHIAGQDVATLSSRTFTNVVNVNSRTFNASWSVGAYPSYCWLDSYGGTQDEETQGIHLDYNGDYYFIGYTESENGDLASRPLGFGDDALVTKFDVQGNIIFTKWFGGSNDERFYSGTQTPDGGMVFVGRTNSIDGIVGSATNGPLGNHDFWVVKLASAGSLVWNNCFGGTNVDIAYSVAVDPDGDIVLAGTTKSNNNDVSGNNGDYDVWLARLASDGSLIPGDQVCLGGTGEERAFSIIRTPDDGYVFVGQTSSNNNGDVTGFKGGRDIWLVKVDSTLTLVWQKCLGGSGDDFGYSVNLTDDGGYIIGGYTDSNNGDVTGLHGSDDGWIVKTDDLGIIQWQRAVGGTNEDRIKAVKQTRDGMYIGAGYTKSSNGDVQSTRWGNKDGWVIKLSNIGSGSYIWDRCYGGTSPDEFYSLHETFDDGLVFSGYSRSNNGDITGAHGGDDAFMIKTDSLGNF